MSVNKSVKRIAVNRNTYNIVKKNKLGETKNIQECNNLSKSEDKRKQNNEYYSKGIESNESGIGLLSKTLSKNQENDEFLLSFDVNSYFQNDNISQLKLTQDDDLLCREFLDDDFSDTFVQECHDDLSQFCESSQVLKQIENVLSECDESLNSENSNTNTCIIDQNNIQSENLNQSNTPNQNKIFKKPILKIRNEEYWNETLASGVTQLFKSSQYKQEVANVFNNLETSIRQLSEAEESKQVQDSAMNSSEDSKFLEFESQGISSAIKRTLISNIQNPVQTLINNQILIKDDTSFTEIGPFYGLPLQVKELIQQYKGIKDLYDWQDECLKLDAVKNRKNLVYTLPTSGGKTLVSEILILREILCRKHNVLFILPYVSIVQEKVWALSPFALALNFLIEEYAAGKGGYPPRKRRYKHSVYIATIEKGLGLVNSLIETGRLKEIGLVVVDELHLMGEQSRGVKLENLLTKLIHATENIHIIGMSATIGNLPEVCKFLKAELFTKDFRPVELKEYVKCDSQIMEVNRNAKTLEECLVPVRTVEYSYTEEISKLDPDRLVGLVMEVIPAGSCLVFCASKKNCENVALLLCRIFSSKLLEHKSKEKDSLLQLLRAEGTICPILKRTLPFGVAYHHSGLTFDERRLIEDSFRLGTICVICCTSTLAAGVNLPAKRVILRSPYIGREFINLARYKQMAGRAGRAGMEEIGESILVCQSMDLRRVAELLCSPMNEVESKMCEDDLKGLRDLILSSIALGTATTRRTLRQITNCTLMTLQEDRLKRVVKKETDQAIAELFKQNAIQLASDRANKPKQDVSVFLQLTYNNESPADKLVIGNDSKLIISNLGKAAIKGGLDLNTAHILYDDLVQAQASLVLLNCLHLLYLVTPYDLATQIQPSLPHYYSIYINLGPKELQTARILGMNEACEAGLLTGRRIKNINERVLNRFYVTLILHDLWNGKSVFEVAEKFQVNRGIVQQLMVSAATFASNVVRFCEQLDEFWAFVHLLKGMAQRLEHCSSQELMSLMELPSVKQGRARQLYRAGFKNLQCIARANANDLIYNVEHISRTVANQLIASAKLLLMERVENLREEAEDVLEGIEI